MCGPSSNSSSSSAATNSTTVTVNPTTNFSLNTADLANAIEVLAASNAAATVIGAQYQAAAQVGSAEIAAQSGPSMTTIVIVVVAVAGLAFTAGIIKLPRGLRA